jgi:hypothetical protein
MNTGRIAGVFYLITFVVGVFAFVSTRGRFTANIITTASYGIVTALFYVLFERVNKSLSLAAAAVSFLGLTLGVLNMLHMSPFSVSPLGFFGVYCLLIGYLIYASTFLPRGLGALLALGGLGWLTFLSPSLAKHLSPYNMLPGVLAEGVLTVWLLVFGVDTPPQGHPA